MPPSLLPSPKPLNVPQTLAQAIALHQQGRLAEAERLYAAILAARPDNFDALHMLGVLRLAQGKPAEALKLIADAMRAKAPSPQVWLNHGLALGALNRNAEAAESFERAIKLKSKFVEAHNNRGVVLSNIGRDEEAVECYRKALAIKPNYADALSNLGNALMHLKRYDEALKSYDRAIAARPNYADPLYNRGITLRELKRYDEALAAYDRALELRPALPEALSNRGNTLRELKRIDEALQSYDRALALRPDMTEALSNRGMILHEHKRYEEALESYDRALAAAPNHIDALNNRGTTLQELKRFEEAQANYDRLLAAQPDHPHAFSGAASCAINLCDWTRRAALAADLPAHVAGRKTTISSFVLLGYSGDPALQLQCARNFVAHQIPDMPQPLWTGQRWRHARLRIAYLSADFKQHATAFLMAELFERHDRARFETIAISFGIDDRSEMRRRLVAAFGQFHDVRTKSDREVAELLRALEVDIAIDLKGYTQDSRPEILAYRPAPIQASYLGYPGTMGAPFIDYIVADKIVAPFEHQPFYDEKIVQLPDSYQVNDTKRTIAAHTPSRPEVGLPEQGFVFCSFNNNWKITPEVFDVWMRLLHEVSGSVLWLLADNPGAERNLRSEAQRRGVDPSRLVFAGRLPPAEHLARHRLADLFLDTLPCNAHTTASDALWAGLPVLTCLGGAFAGRVAASLVNAAGLPELIAPDLDAYHALALKLAREPALLTETKARLAHNRDTCPLFDPARFARHIEAAFTTMWETWQRGEAPKGFAVAPID